jgi:SecD/SecF fusion protein
VVDLKTSGSFDVTETKDLANVLRAGKLPASADIVQSEVVGPSLGQAIDNGTNSAIVGLLLVSLWMMVYYGKAGWYANIALAVNLLFLWNFASLGSSYIAWYCRYRFDNGYSSRC